MGIKRLAGKTVKTIQEEGVVELVKKTRRYIKQRHDRNTPIVPTHQFKDVLFINGCGLPHPNRYRVDHQIEQLEAANLSADRIDVENLELEYIKYYRSFVIFRCPINPLVEEFIKVAKEENKVVFYDIDDLVIDTKYTDQIKYLESMSKDERSLYDDGVNRMGTTLKQCDYAITSTTRLAKELKNYVSDVYVNRNVSSEEMIALSEEAYKNKNQNDEKVILGYLSGSITHNDDFNMILPALKKVMEKNESVYLQVVGYLDIPTELESVKDRILISPFIDWQKIPKLIASLDINLVPLDDTVFNEAKSENKWVEASLCRVATIASNVGAFAEKIKDNETGLLCKNNKEWETKLTKLISDKQLRERLAKAAYQETSKQCVTTYTGKGLADFIESKLSRNIAFVLPSTNTSGGINVAIKHALILKKNGYDVFMINNNNKSEDVVVEEGRIGVIPTLYTTFKGRIDTTVATMWTTVDFVWNYPNTKNRSYLVQGYETELYSPGDHQRRLANATYSSYIPLKYITISKWCQRWLKEDFGQESTYAPNGIKIKQFPFKKRDFKGKIKILIEGSPDNYYKNMDETFKIVEKLDKEKFEIHFLSYYTKPKKWYRVDKVIMSVPYDEVGKVFQDCDILLKSSILESFSYPPLEMMATGGVSVVAPNYGNVEYLKDNENCLFYELGNIDQAVEKINTLCNDEALRKKLIKNGLKTVKERAWENIEEDILKLYVKSPIEKKTK